MIKIEEKKNQKILHIDGLPQMVIPNNIEYRKNMSEVLFVKAMDDHIDRNNLKILNIGLGAGYTTAEILKRNYVSKVDVIEIYQEVIDLLPNFDTFDSIINDNRVNIICDDAENFIKYSNKKYDIIVIDICHPHIDCSKKLFEYKFLNDLKNNLSDNGIILFWYYSIRTREDHIKEVLNTLKKIYSFVDFIKIAGTSQTYFFISDIKYEIHKDSLLRDLI